MLHRLAESHRTRVLCGLLLLAGAAATYLLHQGVLARRAKLPPEQDIHYLPTPGALRVFALRYTELMADLIWLRQVIYFGDQLVGKGDFRHVDMYLRTAIALDPNFRKLYAWAGIAYTASGLPVTNVAVRMSNEILEMGLKRFPDDWELNFMLGVNYIHELKTSDPKLKQSWRMKGAEHIRRAAMTGKGPPWLPVLVATLFTKGGETQAAIRHLEEILLTTEDEKVREHVRNKLMQLHKEALPALEREREEFLQSWRTHMPYVPQDLFVFLGPPPENLPTKELAVPELMRTWERMVEDEAEAQRDVTRPAPHSQ